MTGVGDFETSAKLAVPWQLARGTAIVSMLWVHGVSWSLPYQDYLNFLDSGWNPSYLYVPGLAALALPGIAGRSFRRLKDGELGRHFLYAWLFFLSGFLVNWLTWGAESVDKWDGLYFLGVTAVCLGGIRKIAGSRMVLPFGLFALVAFELISVFWGINSIAWLRPFLGGRNPPVTWPVLPWLSLFLFSFVADEKNLPMRWSWTVLFLLFFAGIGYENGFSILRHLDVWTHNPFCQGAGLVVSVWCGLMLVLKSFSLLPEPWRNSVEKVLVPFSEGTFWIYVLHVPLGYPLATQIFSAVPTFGRIFLTPSVLILSAWGLGRFVSWISRKRLRVVLVAEGKRGAS